MRATDSENVDQLFESLQRLVRKPFVLGKMSKEQFIGLLCLSEQLTHKETAVINEVFPGCIPCRKCCRFTPTDQMVYVNSLVCRSCAARAGWKPSP